jgi:hypothetical protein
MVDASAILGSNMTDKEISELRETLMMRYAPNEDNPTQILGPQVLVKLALDLCTDIPKEELPLHINHANEITRYGVSWRLERDI